MENYTKYALKSWDELTALLEGKNNLFVVACNKCFKEFDSVNEPELDTFLKLAEAYDKTVTGTASIDFLCNKTQTNKALADRIPEGTEHIVVISCGLGIQTVADLKELPVYAACDSVSRKDGHHGMAMTKKTCGACAQCYLNMTGGICPIVDCSKSLVNGQCGGAKNGKCEVSPDMECGWERIYQKLKKLGRLDVLKCPIQLRDYAKDDKV